MDGFAEYNVIFDTATDLVAINGHLCQDCPGPFYSVFFGIMNGTADLVSRETKNVEYGESNLQGYDMTGMICIDQQQSKLCLEEFPYLYLTKQDIFNENVSGVIGLARPRPFHLMPV